MNEIHIHIILHSLQESHHVLLFSGPSTIISYSSPNRDVLMCLLKLNASFITRMKQSATHELSLADTLWCRSRCRSLNFLAK